jgi:hypothetical protein
VPNAAASIGWGLAVGASLLAGAVAAVVLQLPSRAAAVLTSFGGGLLFAAVALELVPEADEQAGTWLTTGGLTAGTLVFVGADAWLSRDEEMATMRRAGHAAAAGQPMAMPAGMAEAARGESIAAGLFVDGVPESIALGLTIAEDELGLALLAGVLVGNPRRGLRGRAADYHRPSRQTVRRRPARRYRPRARARHRPGRDAARGRQRRARGHGTGGRRRGRLGGRLDLDRAARLRGGEPDGRDRDDGRLRRRLPAQLSAGTQRAK